MFRDVCFALLLPHHYVCKLKFAFCVRSQPADQSTSQMGWAGWLSVCFVVLCMGFRNLLWISPNITYVMLGGFVFHVGKCFVVVFVILLTNQYVWKLKWICAVRSQPAIKNTTTKRASQLIPSGWLVEWLAGSDGFLFCFCETHTLSYFVRCIWLGVFGIEMFPKRHLWFQ